MMDTCALKTEKRQKISNTRQKAKPISNYIKLRCLKNDAETYWR